MARRRLRPQLWLALALAIDIVACRQILGIQEEPARREVDASASVDAGGSACGISFGTAACQACADERCCGLATACSTSPACATYETCLASCTGDAACRSQCSIDHPVGTLASVPALDRCLAAECKNECGLECGGLVFDRNPDAGHCATCVSGAACSLEETCATSYACQTLQHCRRACQTLDCWVACSLSNQLGAASNREFVNAINVCRTECELGNYWKCVGKVVFPYVRDGYVEGTVDFIDYTRGTPVSDLLVKICARTDPACRNELAQHTSDALGAVTFAAQIGFADRAYGLDGFLDISSPSATIVPTLYFWSFPLSERNASFITFKKLPTFSPASLALTALGVQLDPSRGHLIVYTWDCAFHPSPDVQFTLTGVDAAMTTPFYFVGPQVSTTATATDGNGVGGFFNVPTGDAGTGMKVEITATPKALGKPSSRVSAFVRPGTITIVDATPTP